jgi:NAD(P)-dependent dehydrogenase (short-subunit alcohol dehydrogenase family)
MGIAVVTGANRGLGLGVAEALLGLGHTVVLAARSLEKARAAVAGLKSPAALPAEADVSDVRSVEELAQRVLSEHGRIDVLVNNAGAIYHDGPSGTFEVPMSTLLEAFQNNTLGAFRLCQLVLPGMNERGFGRIVNVSSGMGGITEMGGGSPAYRLSKAALNATTRIFHADARGNVKVNSVCPGWVKTDMGGPHATRNLEEGVRSILWAATLGPEGPSGGFFRDGKPLQF